MLQWLVLNLHFQVHFVLHVQKKRNWALNKPNCDWFIVVFRVIIVWVAKPASEP